MAIINLSTVEDYDGNAVPYPDDGLQDIGAYEFQGTPVGEVASTTSVSGEAMAEKTFIGTSASVSSVSGDSKIAWSLAGTVAAVSTVAGIIDIFKPFVGNPTSTSVVTSGINIEKSLIGDMVSVTSTVSAATEIPWPGFLGGELRLRMDMGMS